MSGTMEDEDTDTGQITKRNKNCKPISTSIKMHAIRKIFCFSTFRREKAKSYDVTSIENSIPYSVISYKLRNFIKRICVFFELIV